MTSNYVLREFHKPEDCIVGSCIKVIGRKFKPNTNHNFVKIEGPADCWIHKECSFDMHQNIINSSEMRMFNNIRFTQGDGFRKKPDLILEPEEGYDGPDFKGTNKHGAKAYGHTPEQQCKVEATNSFLFAIGYIDINRQKRSGKIELIRYEISNKGYSLN